ncbi:MAG: large-conductance mechanosensitive channel protein MscL [Clostridia bacterium]|nr:large-conductance mechanosensitive channel protein MscL [Clostridia bacterium]MBR5681293.1 large-conductance mechanosensitive channel protein MscL [Clostridia bacterium]MCR5681192.1 large-conductance mechanosensitive channel protein MscL [Clostridiales bacterium]
MAEKSTFWSEFKTFIARGNVMDMAVGVVVGGAFTAIVNSLVGDIINPLIGKLFGGVDLSEAKVVLTEATEETAEVAIRYGALIQTIINFLIVALCVFAVVRGINKLKDKMKKEEEEAAAEEEKEEEPAEPSEEVLLLREIRDSLQK